VDKFHGVPFRLYATSCAREVLEAKVPNLAVPRALEFLNGAIICLQGRTYRAN
jgi:hypothetical protein